MKHTPGNNPKPPTSRDGIETWLDVLTSMLSLPPSQRTQVRDELEDHLRSRVDDLLILGKSEPEAIRTAISELGETAQLARHISSASRTPKSFRRFAMNATFFVLAGSILTASVSMMMPTSEMHTAASKSIEQRSSETVTHIAEPESRAVNIEDAVLWGAIDQLASIFDRQFVATNSAKKEIADLRRGTMTSSINGEMTLKEAIAKVHGVYVSQLINLQLEVSDTEIKLLTQDEFSRSQVEIHAYPIPAWAESSDEQYKYGNSIQSLVSTKHDLEYTTIQPVNGSLVVAAPPAVHAEIIELAAQLKAISESMLEQREQQRIQQRALMTQRIERLRAEYEAAKRMYFAERRTGSDLSNKVSKLSNPMLFRETTDKLSDEQEEAIQSEINSLREQFKQQEITTEEARARFQRLQEILIDAEADLILSEFNDARPVGGAITPVPTLHGEQVIVTADE